MKTKKPFFKFFNLRFTIVVLLGLFSTSSIYAEDAIYKNYPFPLVDVSSALNDYQGYPNSENSANEQSFAAINDDGSITAWGSSSQGGSSAPTDNGYIKIYSTSGAFAALKEDGSISAWGSSSQGGSGAPTDSGYVTIYSTRAAFAALKEDGSITSWGDPRYGASDVPTDNSYVTIYSTGWAFAALKEDGHISAWGSSSQGGSGAPTDDGYIKIYSTYDAFAALKEDGSISTWGEETMGGTGAPTDNGYVKIYSTYGAFAALKENGSISAWGNTNYGGSGAPTDNGYIKIHSTEYAFAALKEDGSISAWGPSSAGGNGAPIDNGYIKIISSGYAFAALKEDGSISAWGPSSAGGSGAPTDKGYVKIYSNYFAFAALKEDGSISAWGSSSQGGSGAPTDNGYIKIISNHFSFIAVKEDGTISVWGDSTSVTGAPSKVASLIIGEDKESQTLEITPNSNTINAGENIELQIKINNAKDLYGAQSTIKVDKPEMLKLSSIKYADMFDKDNRLEIPSEDNALGEATEDKFDIAISLKNPATPINESGVFANIKYDTTSNSFGTIKLTPENVVLSDQNGIALNSSSIGATIIIENPIFTEDGNTVKGSVIFPLNVTNDNLIITLKNSNGDTYTTTIDENGNFEIKNLKDGEYTIYADQSPYYAQCNKITIQDGQVTTMDSLKMISGDINTDGTIDIADVTLIASYFGENASNIPADVKFIDVNNDGIINIQDLALVGASFGMERCQ